MNRRVFVVSRLASAAVFFIAERAGAETATPIATPLVPLPGAYDEVYRSFKLASPGFDTMITGKPLWLSFDILLFSDAEQARGNILPVRDNFIQSYRNHSTYAYDFGAPRAASIRAMGDESHAWTVSMPTEDAQAVVDAYTLAIVVARDGPLLISATAVAASGNPFGLLGDLTQAILARHSNSGSVTVDADGLHHGRLWDYLPTLHDVPEGYTFFEDYPP